LLSFAVTSLPKHGMPHNQKRAMGNVFHTKRPIVRMKAALHSAQAQQPALLRQLARLLSLPSPQYCQATLSIAARSVACLAQSFQDVPPRYESR
jgi:hypothetical protein